MNLENIFTSHEGRESIKWCHYPYYFERHLNHFVGQPVTIFEIGVSTGGSLQIWKKYFGPNCKVIGIDIDPSTMYNESQIFTECGSQTDLEFLKRVIEKHGRPDIIIDDGSHLQRDILKTLNFLFDFLNDGGYYIIEDLHASYWEKYEGGITSPYNFVSLMSRCVHDVNKQFIEEPYKPYYNDLAEISFYNSLIFMRKGNPPDVRPIRLGK